MRSIPRVSRVLTLGLIVAGLVGPGAARAGEPVRLVVESATPAVTVVARDAGTTSLADLRILRSPASADDGRNGTRWSVEVVNALPDAADPAEDRIAIAILAFGTETLVLAGVTTGIPADPGTPLVWAVLGGTGAFAGVRGEAVTTTAPDGSTEDRLTLAGIGMTEPAETLVLVTDPAPAVGTGPEADPIRTAERALADGTGAGTGTVRAVTVDLGTEGAAPVAAELGVLRLGSGERIFHAGLVRDGTAGGRERAIIGGTGRFAGARGTLAITDRGDGTTELTVTLLAGSPDGAASLGALRSMLTPRTPAPVDVDRDGGGIGYGDLRVWRSPAIVDEISGGASEGVFFLVSEPTEADPRFRRLGLQVYRIPEGGTLVVAGEYEYDAADGPIPGMAPIERAVAGGTGRFSGASGTVTTVREGDDLYSHLFQAADGG